MADEEDEIKAEAVAREGGSSALLIERWARSSGLARRRKIEDCHKCQACGQQMQDLYGEFGKNLADAHHLIWPAPDDGERDVDISELRTLCPNCHRALHVLLKKHHARTLAQGQARLEMLQAIVRDRVKPDGQSA